ncbi:MAG: hypothetical protein KME06_01265 [Kastovskya adunca ATA6-11-RM4]|nr:hypothetical protein [Kastovskya adunca ATA6-11-RM4]
MTVSHRVRSASPLKPWCDRPIESWLVSRYRLIHKQGLNSTQPNLQRRAISLVPILRLGMLREGSASSKRQSRIGVGCDIRLMLDKTDIGGGIQQK